MIGLERVLCDLGANVSLVPLCVFQKHGLGDMKSNNIFLQLEDRSIEYPFGILEDVPIRIRQLFIPTNFVIMEIEEDT